MPSRKRKRTRGDEQEGDQEREQEGEQVSSPPRRTLRPRRPKSPRTQPLTLQYKAPRPKRSKPLVTPTDTQSITTAEQEGEGSQDASGVQGTRNASNTLTPRDLAEAVSKMVENPKTVELMILELMDKYSFSLPDLKELLKGKPSRTPLSHTIKSLLGSATD